LLSLNEEMAVAVPSVLTVAADLIGLPFWVSVRTTEPDLVATFGLRKARSLVIVQN
jgi:hypothetical protein